MRMVAGHSFNRGTGQSTILANLAACLAMNGKQVCLVDACYSSPSIHFFYGLDPDEINYTLNDYLWGKCDIGETVISLTRRLQVSAQVKGQLTLVSASPNYREIMRIMRGGFYADLLGDGLQELAAILDPDIMLIDASSGIDEPTTLLLSLADLLFVILRPDQRDFFGTGILLDVAQKLEIPDVELLINQVPPGFEMNQVLAEVSRTYQRPVVLGLPYSEAIAASASAGLIVLRQPDNPATKQFNHLANHVAKHWEPLGSEENE